MTHYAGLDVSVRTTFALSTKQARSFVRNGFLLSLLPLLRSSTRQAFRCIGSALRPVRCHSGCSEP